jgi:hypothetical protein
MTRNLLTINPTPLRRGFLLAWSSFHESHIRLGTGLMTRPECGLSDQPGLILWWPVDGVLDGVLEIMLPLESYLGHFTRSIPGLIRDQRSSLAGCWATPSERHRVALAYLCLRQVRKNAEQAKTPVRKRKKVIPVQNRRAIPLAAWTACLARAGTVWSSNSILTMQGVSLHGPDS